MQQSLPVEDSRYSSKEEIADIIQLEEELSKNANNRKSKTDKKKRAKVSYKKSSLFELFSKKKKGLNKISNKYGDNDMEAGLMAGTMLLAEGNPYNSTQQLNGKVLKNQGTGRDIPLINFPIYVGNSMSDAVCKIENIMVSRRHAVITWECGRYYVEDQGSTNGTFINGSRISPYEPVQINDDDIVAFANEAFRLN